MSVKKIDKALNAGWVEPHLFVPLKNVPKDKEDILAQLRNIPAVEQRETMGRTYPAGKAAAHLVGYVGKITAEELEKKDPGIYEPSDMIGKRGLEQLYEEQLKGEKGAKVTIKKEDEEIVLAEKKAKNGENIIVTIDVNIQEKIYDAYDGKAGTAAAINPKTGETLALVSSPAFNPNDFVYGISQTEWDNLENDPLQPMINRFASTYAPGSVMKPITAAIGLSNGTIKPEEGITINGLTWSGGEGWGDYKVRRVSTSSQPVDLADALIRSDNIYFAMKAVEMGNEKYIEGLKKFGFGEKLPYSYPMTNSSISNDGKLSDDVLLANTSYGQGQIEMSSLHLAVTYTPFLNDGNMIKPTLLASEKTGEIWHENIISPEQAETMQEDLRAVVTKGTAKAAQKASFPISGKTGTAELKSSSKAKGRENGWFVGYPTDDQDILIAMMMENVQDVGASGFVTEKVTEILSDVKIKED